MRLEARAPAKINLTLEVLGRRPDGYHEIASVMHAVRLSDHLILELPDVPALSATQGTLALTGETAEIPTDSRNLIWRAVGLFVAAVPALSVERHAPWRAYVQKAIPAQAGLGGGSSDAAATLRLLGEWVSRMGLPTPHLHALASELGADVAFFLNGACALARGRGEQIEPLPALPLFWWVLAKPRTVGVSTAWAYAQLKREAVDQPARAPYAERLLAALAQNAIRVPEDLAPLLHNDFDRPILEAVPMLAAVRQQMLDAGALRVILCGSGAAQAGLCASQSDAQRIADTLTQHGYWAVATPLACGEGIIHTRTEECSDDKNFSPQS